TPLRDPRDSNARATSTRNRHSMRRELIVDIDQFCSRPHGGGVVVDLDRTHGAYVDDQSSAGRRARKAVTAATGRDSKPEALYEGKHPLHVARAGATSDG